MGVKPGDHQADQRAYQAAGEQGGGEGEDARAESGILKDLGEDDGGEQAADVGDVGNGEVQSAGDDGHEHCQRQDAQLRQLEGDGAECRRRECLRRNHGEQRGGGAEEEEHQPGGVFLESVHAWPLSLRCSVCHWVAAMAARMTAPETALKA